MFVPLNSSLEERSRPHCCSDCSCAHGYVVIGKKLGIWRRYPRYPKSARSHEIYIYKLRFNEDVESSPGITHAVRSLTRARLIVTSIAPRYRFVPEQQAYIHRINAYTVRSDSDPSSRRILVYWLIENSTSTSTNWTHSDQDVLSKRKLAVFVGREERISRWWMMVTVDDYVREQR